jgi:hypothetical protein
LHPDVIELQLAHADRDEVRGAYNKTPKLRVKFLAILSLRLIDGLLVHGVAQQSLGHMRAISPMRSSKSSTARMPHLSPGVKNSRPT